MAPSASSRAREPAGTLERLRANKWVAFAVVAISVFMGTLDASIVNISLPAIASYFSVALTGTVEWVIIAYLVVVASVLLTIGRLSDLIGRKVVLLGGVAIFTLGSGLLYIKLELSPAVEGTWRAVLLPERERWGKGAGPRRFDRLPQIDLPHRTSWEPRIIESRASSAVYKGTTSQEIQR